MLEKGNTRDDTTPSCITHPSEKAVPNGNRLSPAALEEALQRKQVVINYQPKINATWSLCTGLEALVRLHHNGKMRTPDQFIDLAESTALASPLTEQVVDQVLGHLQRWRRDHGLLPKVAINLPIHLLENSALPDWLSDRADAYGVPREHIMLEITERSDSERLGEVLQVAVRLRLAGFGLSIDDFGEGFSSEDRLRQLPFSELKLGRSLVTQLHRPAPHRQINRAIQLAKDLSLEVVAEGVEDETQQDHLLSLGCAVHQGFYYAAPLTASDTPLWLLNQQQETVRVASKTHRYQAG